MAEIKGALFDMDGLLLDTETIAQQAFISATAPHGLTRTAATDAFPYFVGGNVQTARPRLKRLFPGADTDSIDHAWGRAFEALIAKGVPTKRTVVETLRALASRGLPMAVVTSSSRAHAEHNLAIAGIREFFEGLVSGTDVSNRKPNAEPYLRGAALLGLAPGACAAFEDSDPGITAAVAAGCVATQIPDIRPPGVAFPALGQRHATTLAEAVTALGLLAD
ncbi:MAG: HAD family phosphatase [Pseudomonadota bacterium]